MALMRRFPVVGWLCSALLLSLPFRLRYPGGDVYEGEFRQGVPWGKGEIRHTNGREYRGDFVRGQFEGKGRLKDSSGAVDEGDFVNDSFTGHGVATGGRAGPSFAAANG